MFKDKRVSELLGLDYPIIQAPMAGASTPEMAAAASNAGCLGSLGCAMMTPKAYKKAFDASRALTNKPLNMNFFCHETPVDDPRRNELATARLEPFYKEFGLGEIPSFEATHFPFGEEMLEAVLVSRPQIVSFHFGLPETSIVERLKAAGCIILSSATTAHEAMDLEERGADAVIAQGFEAGGHQGYYLEDESSRIGTFALVPQVVDAVSVPVIAAGGIADGRGIVAALALGASGVQIGTAFSTAAKPEYPPPIKRHCWTPMGPIRAPQRHFPAGSQGASTTATWMRCGISKMICLIFR